MELKQRELLSGVVALISSALVLFFFIDFTSKPIGSFYIKPGYDLWVWGVLSLSSTLYYLVRSGGKLTTGGYTHPLFKKFLRVLTLLPFLGLMVSSINSLNFIAESGSWHGLLETSESILEAILILFVLAHLGAGISGIKQYWKIKRNEGV